MTGQNSCAVVLTGAGSLTGSPNPTEVLGRVASQISWFRERKLLKAKVRPSGEMLVHPSIEGEFSSVDELGSDWMSIRGDQSPNAGIATAATAVSAQRPAAPVAASCSREANCFMFPPNQCCQIADDRRGVESRPVMCDEDLPRILWGIANPRTAGGARDGMLKPADLASRADMKLGLLTVSPSRRAVKGPAGEAHLEPRVMQVFVLLLELGDRVVTRTEIFEQCWGGAMVGDDNINRAIAAIRKVVDEVAPCAVEVETIPRTGYRLVGADLRQAQTGIAADPAKLRRSRAAELVEQGRQALREELPEGHQHAITVPRRDGQAGARQRGSLGAARARVAQCRRAWPARPHLRRGLRMPGRSAKRACARSRQRRRACRTGEAMADLR